MLTIIKGINFIYFNSYIEMLINNLYMYVCAYNNAITIVNPWKHKYLCTYICVHVRVYISYVYTFDCDIQSRIENESRDLHKLLRCIHWECVFLCTIKSSRTGAFAVISLFISLFMFSELEYFLALLYT